MEGFGFGQGHSTDGFHHDGETSNRDRFLLLVAIQRALAAEQMAAAGEHAEQASSTLSSSHPVTNHEGGEALLRALVHMSDSGDAGPSRLTNNIVESASMTAALQHQHRSLVTSENSNNRSVDLIQQYLVRKALEQQDQGLRILEEMLQSARQQQQQEQTLHLRQAVAAAASAAVASSANTEIGRNASLVALCHQVRHGMGAGTSRSHPQESLNILAAAAASSLSASTQVYHHNLSRGHHGLNTLLGPASLNSLSSNSSNTIRDLSMSAVTTNSARMSTSLLAQQLCQLEQLELLKAQQQQQPHRIKPGLYPQHSHASTTATVPVGPGHSPRACTAARAVAAAQGSSATPKDDDAEKKRPASMSGLTSRALAAAKRAVSATSNARQNLKQGPPEEGGTRKRPFFLLDDDDDDKSSSASFSNSTVANDDDNAPKIAAMRRQQEQLASNSLVGANGSYNDGGNSHGPAVPVTATSDNAHLALPLLSSLSALLANTPSVPPLSVDDASLALLQEHHRRLQKLQELQRQRQQLLASLLGQAVMPVLPQASSLPQTLPRQLQPPAAARSMVASGLKTSAAAAAATAANSSSPASPPLDMTENFTMQFGQRPTLEKPQRPLSAYNFFFRDERTLMLRELADQEALLPAEIEDEDVGGDNDEHQRNPKRKKKKRKKRPTIGFAVLAQRISALWKNIDAVRLKEYTAMAAADKERYNMERDAYRAQLAQEAFALLEEGSDSASNSDDTGGASEE